MSGVSTGATFAAYGLSPSEPMRIAYTKPAAGERYLVDKNVARRVARAMDPDLGMLAFQTRHGPNMTKGLAYCATYSLDCLRILSVQEELISEAMSRTFVTTVVPWLLTRLIGFRVREYSWPCVVVALDGAFIEASCSAGALSPGVKEIRAGAKGGQSVIAEIR